MLEANLYELRMRVVADMLCLPLLERRPIANRSKAHSFCRRVLLTPVSNAWNKARDPRQILQ